MIKSGEVPVSILGTEYKVLFGKKEFIGLHSECIGQCHVYTKRILVDTFCEECTEEEIEARTKEVVAHEVLHAYLNEAGVNCGNGEEAVCDFFMKNWVKINNTILDILDKFQCI